MSIVRRPQPAAHGIRPVPIWPNIQATWFRAGLLFAYAVIVTMKIPQILIKGRFWAEEGAVYFIGARTQPWLDALFSVHTGYLNLAASLATLLAAHAVPLDQAPWVSTMFALLVQLCPAALLLTSGISWLQGHRAIIVGLLLIVITPTSGEVWLNSITSQFHLGLCTALILAMPPCQGLVSVLRGVLLLFAGFSGPASAFLAPLFFARAYSDVSRYRLKQSILLGFACIVQIVTISTHPEPGRTYSIGVQLLGLIVYERNILLPFLGPAATGTVSLQIEANFLQEHDQWGPVVATFSTGAMLIWAAWQSRNVEVRWILSAGLAIMTMTYFGALGHHVELLNIAFGDRYSYIQSALFSLTLFGVAQTAHGLSRWIGAILVGWLICTGAIAYLRPPPPFVDGPSWQAEVAKWRIDPNYQIQFWPDEKSWHWYMLPSLTCLSQPTTCSDRHR